jgi:hypothetical protein
VTQVLHRALTTYHSNVDNSARDRDRRRPRTPSTPVEALMVESHDHGLRPQNVYDIAPVPPGTNPAPSTTSVRSGRRTGMATTSRIVKGDALDEEVRPLCIRPRRGAQVLARVEVPGLGADPGRCIAFRQRRMFVISTLRCRCRKLLPRGTAPQKARVVDGNRALVRKPRLVLNPWTIFTRFPDLRHTQAG